MKLLIGIGTALLFGASVQAASPKLDHEMSHVLSELEKKGGKPIESLTPAEARKQPTPTDAVKSILAIEKRKVETNLAEVKDIQVQGAAGLIPARVYTPKAKGLRPVVVYFHGGGFVIADNDVYDSTPSSLAALTDAIFISVEYRKAPEFKFPAAHDDAFAAYNWVLKNAAALGGDPKKVAVAGESAGGNLALNVAIRARDEGVQAPVSEILVYPVAGTDMNTDSYIENAEAKPLNKPMMAWFFKQYTNSPADAQDHRLNLIEANLAGLSPVTVITAEVDPLRSEGKELADRSKKAKVKVTYENYKGVTHEFFGMSSVLADAKSAQQLAASSLKKSFK